MSVPLTYWYDRVIIQCPGLDETLFGVALHKVMREYFRDSRAWCDELTVAATAGTDTIDLDVQYNTPAETYKRVAQIWAVYANDRYWPPLASEPFRFRYDTEREGYWAADQYHILKLSAPLSEDTTLRVTVTVKPLDGATQVPDFVAEQHDDAIESGLLAYFMAVPAKPWTNLTVAAYHQRQYREYVAEARAVAERAYTPADTQWTYPRSFV